MARNKINQQNIDNSNPALYPDGRIKDNDGSNNGTPINENVYGDIHEFFAKMMRESKINYNGFPDNNSSGYQLYESLILTANKNDFIYQIIPHPSTATIEVPLKFSNLKTGEFFIFKSTFNSHLEDDVLFNTSVGLDNLLRPTFISGRFKVDQYVRCIVGVNNLDFCGLYDTQIAPNLIERLTLLEEAIQPMLDKLAVFQEGGGMLFWNKPLADIPLGWQEVVDWRGRMPIGLKIDDTDFNVMGKQGGEKKRKILKANLPAVGADFWYQKSTSGQWRTSGGSGTPTTNVVGDANISNAWEFSVAAKTRNLGDGADFELLNPYRVVLFIEYVGT